MLSDKGIDTMNSSFPLKVILLQAFLLFATPAALLCQETTSCARKLEEAQSLYDRGQVEKIPDALRECMRSGFKREEQLAAYKLLIQAYLLDDKIREADSTMLQFLKTNPEYQLSPTDHASFVYLYNNFNVKPVLQLVLHAGTNLPFVTFVDHESVSGTPTPKEYKNKLNLFISLEAKYMVNPVLEVNIEPGYSSFSLSSSELLFDFAVADYSEVHSRLEIPVTVTYKIASFGKLTAYARAGAGPAFNLQTTAKKVSFDEIGVKNFTTQTIFNVDRQDSRIKMDLFGQAGIGVKYKIPRGYVNFEVRGNFGLYNQVIREGESAGILESYGYKDDKYNLNDMCISLGYTQIFYKPTKRK